MPHLNRSLLILMLTLLFGAPLAAAEKEKPQAKPKPEQKASAPVLLNLLPATLELSAEQKAKLTEIEKEYRPRLEQIQKKADVLTEEQKGARAAALKAAATNGKKGPEAKTAAEAAAPLTVEQKQRQLEAKQEMQALMREAKEKVFAVLTDEQKAQLREKQRPAKGEAPPKK